MFDNSYESYWAVRHVVLFITLYKVDLIFRLWMKPCFVTIDMKANEQYLYEVLFITLNKVVLTENRQVCKVATWPNPTEIIRKNNF